MTLKETLIWVIGTTIAGTAFSYIVSKLRYKEPVDYDQNMRGSVSVTPIQTSRPEPPKPQPLSKLNICKEIDFGTYECAVIINGIQCDKCLSEEIASLNKSGIKTMASCCGHDKSAPFIQVDKDHVESMLSLGYAIIPVDEFGYGEDAFYPKSELPQRRLNK